MTVTDALQVAGLVIAIAGLLGVGYVKLRSDAKSAREEASEATLKIVTQNRDELQAQVDRQNITIAGQASEIKVLHDMVTAKQDIANLAITVTKQHTELMGALADVVKLLGGQRDGEQA